MSTFFSGLVLACVLLGATGALGCLKPVPLLPDAQPDPDARDAHEICLQALNCFEQS
jgi:hypothetical protein